MEIQHILLGSKRSNSYLLNSSSLSRELQAQNYSGKAVAEAQKIYSLSPASWWEDAWNRIMVSPDGQSAVFTRPWKGSGAINVKTIDDLRMEHAGSIDKIDRIAYKAGSEFAVLGEHDNTKGWFLPRAGKPELLSLPSDVVPFWSPDGRFIAFQKSLENGAQLSVGVIGKEKPYNLDGQITGLCWSPDGTLVYALVWHKIGVSSLVRLEHQTGRMDTIIDQLDAAPWSNTIAVSPDGRRIYLALASEGVADNEARHKPSASRYLRIYEVDWATGTRHVKVVSPGDAFAPAVADGSLYWNQNDIHHQVVVLPSSGGASQLILDDAGMPRWRLDGKQIGFTYGGWRLADWALNLDTGVVDLDRPLRVVSPPRPMVTGYHEDFTPAWSPDGQWIAYHSHRSPTPVAYYEGEGSTDDIYLRRSRDDSHELRLTRFGLEAGPPDWAPDGRRLIFSSREKSDNQPKSKPWIITIDPETGNLLETSKLELPEPIGSADELSWCPHNGEIALIERADEAHRVIWTLSLDRERSREKLVEYSSMSYGGLDWTPDGGAVVYSALLDDRMQLFAVDRLSGVTRQLTEESGNMLHPQVSPDGQWIACTKSLVTKELWKQKL
ncbi:MAG: hypothetical protein AUJ07_04030 [Crenarchaeota archaeon 13_1_40CM_3_53_5]|nr:MAG: hypothetical protein AUJ07_04030 [Crenarchaeota archaeon 13_1_40CM_3_53_5]